MTERAEKQEFLELLSSADCFLKGHFVYASRRHGEDYVDEEAILLNHDVSFRLCRAIAQKFMDYDVEVVVGPESGGSMLAHITAHFLSSFTGRKVLSVSARKIGRTDYGFKRGHDLLVACRKVLVVDDTATTGGTVAKVVALLRSLGSEVVGVGIICKRDKISKRAFGEVPKLVSLVNVNFPSWAGPKCPLCIENKIPVDLEHGHGWEFLKGKSPGI